ncbi:unnamed protein product [Adineta steineri]|uniref:Uncharacterized protein n=1 Tax=Adineta steineri TaxID=433720 RepID=A0A819MTS9_9BILA|nr:unnamed protein product [Adineta steineri]CAF3986015.1 unnamed protein product [Adineta steineri]
MSRTKVERKYNPAQYDSAFDSLPINSRRCVVFSPDNPNKKLCHCNRAANEHPEIDNQSGQNEEWRLDTHTIKEPNKEQGVCLTNGAPYVRCDIETDPTIVETILLDIWKIPRPALLMQIIGGHKYFKLQGKMGDTFLDDLVKFVSKSNTWLLTSGANVGIVQLLGQTIRKRKLTKPLDKTVAIGVCNYGCVKNIKDFQRLESNNSSLIESQDLKNVNQWRAGEQSLEMNHTHFLLLDDGTIRYFDIGDYRTRLVKTIAHKHTNQTLPIPIVTLLFEGGEDSIRSIYNDLRRNIPIIIINNTARIADYLVRWLSRTTEMDLDVDWTNPVDINDYIISNDSNNLDSTTNPSNNSNGNPLFVKFEKYIDSMSDELFQAINGTDRSRSRKIIITDNLKTINDNILLMILYCLQPKVRSKISIFDYNKNEKLSETILRSICKSVEIKIHKKKSNLKKTDTFIPHFDHLLELAIDWDCINTAKEWIVQDSLDNIYDKKSIFFRALTKQRHKFVHYFIQLGFEIDEIFFHPKLNPFASRNNNKRYQEFISLLYTEEAINREDWLLRNIIQTTNDRNEKIICSTDDLNQLFRDLIGGYIKKLYYDTQIEEEEDRMGIKHFTNIISPMPDIEQGQLVHTEIIYKQLAKDYIIRDLFLWAIAMNYMELAKVFLAHMKDRICGALIATEILSHLRDKSSDAVYGDIKIDLTRWIKYFEQYALNCMDLCFKNDPNMAQILTVQRVEAFGDVTCLQVADDANSKRFASHPCCRQAENSIWYDKLHSDQFHIRYYIGQLIGIWTLGLLAPFTARFRTVNQNPLPTEPTLQPYGINYCDSYAINHFDSNITKKLYQIWQFHQSLHIKFTYHHIQYTVFLFLFSYVLLFSFEPIYDDKSSIHPAEIYVILSVTCMLIEEIRIFFSQDSLSLMGKCYNYFGYFFKQLCLISFILFYIGLILRFKANGYSETFQAARVFLGYDLWLWWMRSLSFITVSPFLGPHLVSIGKMLKNLAFFAIFIAVMMTAYGVASRSMAFYGTFPFTGRDIFKAILYPVYYLLYTNLSGELSGLDESSYDTTSIATHVLLAFHMLLINVLLVNLLIAMFNQSFQDVQSIQTDIWNYQQYAVVREYYDRPPLFLPFSTIFDIIALIKMFYHWYLRVRYNYANPLQRVFKVIAVQPELELVWQEFESASTYAYAQREALTKIDRGTVENDSVSRESGGTSGDLSGSNNRKENDAITQLRNEFKIAIRDIRNDIRLIAKQK